jgi:menaquinone-dependent protoporphyrinogen IX oxidase
VKIQIIYYSKYGSTKEIAQAIGRKLKTATVGDIRELKEITGDVIVIGSAIYSEVPHKDIERLLVDKEGQLQDKPVALFAVCLRKTYIKSTRGEGGGPVYIKKMERALGRPSIASMIFGGRMIVSKLDAEDRERTETFAKRQGMPFKDVDVMADTEVDEFIEDITTKIVR